MVVPTQGVGWCLVLALAFGQLACRRPAEVVRKHGDVVETGRAIPAEAYAHYARGLVLEQRGSTRQAEGAYRSALHADPQSGAAWAALVRVVCEDSASSAQALARRAQRNADRPALALVSLGRCRLGDDAARAATLAHNALSHEPNMESALLLLRDARLATRGPHSAARVPALANPPKATGAPLLAQIDRALGEQNLERAQLLATGVLFAGELAVRAWANGEVELAREQTQFAIQLNPDDADACLTAMLLHSSFEEPPLSCSFGPSDSISELAFVLLAAHVSTTSRAAAEKLLASRPVSRAIQDDPAARVSLLYLASWSLAPEWKAR